MTEEIIPIGTGKEVFELKKFTTEDYEAEGDNATPFETHVLTYIDGELVSHSVNGKEVSDGTN